MKNIQKIVLRSTDMQTISARLPGLTGEKNVINNGKKNTHIKLYIHFFSRALRNTFLPGIPGIPGRKVYKPA